MSHLTAARVTRLARAAVHGRIRFTSTAIAPGAFRTRPLVGGVEGVDGEDVETTLRLLNDARSYFIRLGFDASVARETGARSFGARTYVLTVIDTPRREQEMAEQEERRDETRARELGYASVDAYRNAPGRAAVESARWTPDEVLPSGKYGVKLVDRGYGPSLHVSQLIEKPGKPARWGATPGCWGLATLAGHAADRLSIDHGAGWVLSAADTAALVARARAELQPTTAALAADAAAEATGHPAGAAHRWTTGNPSLWV